MWVIFLFLPLSLFSQFKATLTLSQSLARDWKQGEVQSFELNHSLNYANTFRFDTLRLAVAVRWAIGVQYYNAENIGQPYILPTDNEVFAEATLRYPRGWLVDPFLSANARTQITESFVVSATGKRTTAKFRDPITTAQTFGLARAFADSLNRNRLALRLGFSYKQIRSEFYTQMTDNPKTPNIKERWKTEIGVEFKSDASLKFYENIQWNGSLELFYNFQKLNQTVFRLNGELQANITRLFGIVLRTEACYDIRQRAGLQYKENVRIGVVYSL